MVQVMETQSAPLQNAVSNVGEHQRFRIRDQVIASHDPRLQSALATIYDAPDRPRCLCRNGGVEMYVAKHQTYIIKRMPGTGDQHLPNCPSYEPDQTLSGLGELIGQAVIEHTPDAVELKVGFPLSRTPGRSTPRGQMIERGEVKAQGPRMSLRAVMHFLFERARFNHWVPAMEGKRSQGVIHKYLMEAAEGVATKGLTLAPRLYVPEPFHDGTKHEIAERRRAKLNLLFCGDDARQFQMSLMIGELKAVEDTAYGHKIWVRHMPDAPLFIDAKTWKRVQRVHSKVLEGQYADVRHKPRIVLCALIYAKREHSYQVDSITLMLTSFHWIPLDGLHELRLINALVEMKRRFVKPLRYDAQNSAQFANALLLDVGKPPMALHLISGLMDSKEQAAKQTALNRLAKMQPARDLWVWRTEDSMPDLPASLA